ncbi:MAG TPA: hypothetical protein PLK34_01475 [Candidatus Pacearchaeota archaeon]|nr:hypothetical protein [Candidatus Pacearchaeota archaeon]
MKQLLLIGLVTLLLVSIIGAGIFLVRASSDSVIESKTVETLTGCGSCDGTCSSSSACGQAGCQMKSEGSCGCGARN